MPTYKGIEMPANNADKIGAMIESAKNRLMGTPVGDFVRGVGEIGGIPKTIVTGTQNSYGANIPTVEGLKQNLVASTPPATELVKDAATGVSRVFNNVNTPTANFGAVPSTTPPSAVAPVVKPAPVDKAVVRPEGDPNFFKGGAQFSGNTLSSIGAGTGMDEKDLADWKARGALSDSKNPEYIALEKERSNPNNALFKEIADKVKDISTFLSGDPLTRKYQIQEMNALKGVMSELGPLTSYGQFGVAGMRDETTQRGQDLMAETSRRGQDITAETAKGLQGIYKDKNAMDALYHSGLLELGKEKIGIEKLKVDAKTPENFLKLATTIAPKIKSVDPATGNEIETHDLQAGIKMLTASGFETPKGFKASMNGGPSLQDFLAAAKKKGTKMTDEQLTQYYNENYKGR